MDTDKCFVGIAGQQGWNKQVIYEMKIPRRETGSRGGLARSGSDQGSRGGWWSLFVGLSLFLASCATGVGHPLKGPCPPKPANHPIAVDTTGLPTRPFERLALPDAHCESQGFVTPTLEHDAILALIREARAAGCDAIIEVTERQPPANWTFKTRVKHFSAVGVVYR